jgi:broad specificity phosphatase PhoE
MTQRSETARSVPTAQRIVVVRHGETTWSATGRHTSRTDLPLTPAGRASAAALRRVLATETFARVFTSLPVSAGQSLLFATAAVGVLGWDRGAPVIERWNDDSHLRCPVSSTGGPGGRDER